jgi:hypothetical protein
MGAMLWYHLTPWRPDPAEALRALQAKFFKKRYNLRAQLQSFLRSAQDALRVTEAEGDPYDLLEHYRDEVAKLTRIASRPLPTEPDKQIAVPHRIWESSGEGIGNVLDVTRVSSRRGVFLAQRLSPRQVRELVGTETPTRAQAEAAMYTINEMLGRGECLCFPVYRVKDRTPASWYFVGNTVD